MANETCDEAGAGNSLTGALVQVAMCAGLGAAILFVLAAIPPGEAQVADDGCTDVPLAPLAKETNVAPGPVTPRLRLITIVEAETRAAMVAHPNWRMPPALPGASPEVSLEVVVIASASEFEELIRNEDERDAIRGKQDCPRTRILDLRSTR